MHEKQDSKEYIRNLGIFHMMEIYDINWFSETPYSNFGNNIECYKGKEENKINPTEEKQVIIVLADNYILEFEPESRQSTAGDYCILKNFINLNSVKTIEKKITQPGVISINWQSPHEVLY